MRRTYKQTFLLLIKNKIIMEYPLYEALKNNNPQILLDTANLSKEDYLKKLFSIRQNDMSHQCCMTESNELKIESCLQVRCMSHKCIFHLDTTDEEINDFFNQIKDEPEEKCWYVEDGDFWMIGYSTLKDNGNGDRDNRAADAIYLNSDDVFRSESDNDWWAYETINDQSRVYREATKEEQDWLDACINAGKFIPKSDLKSNGPTKSIKELVQEKVDEVLDDSDEPFVTFECNLSYSWIIYKPCFSDEDSISCTQFYTPSRCDVTTPGAGGICTYNNVNLDSVRKSTPNQISNFDKYLGKIKKEPKPDFKFELGQWCLFNNIRVRILARRTYEGGVKDYICERSDENGWSIEPYHYLDSAIYDVFDHTILNTPCFYIDESRLKPLSKAEELKYSIKPIETEEQLKEVKEPYGNHDELNGFKVGDYVYSETYLQCGTIVEIDCGIRPYKVKLDDGHEVWIGIISVTNIPKPIPKPKEKKGVNVVVCKTKEENPIIVELPKKKVIKVNINN